MSSDKRVEALEEQVANLQLELQATRTYLTALIAGLVKFDILALDLDTDPIVSAAIRRSTEIAGKHHLPVERLAFETAEINNEANIIRLDPKMWAEQV